MGSAGGRAAQWRAAVLKCLTAVVLATGAYVFYAHRVTMLDQVEDIVAGPRGADGTRSGGARAGPAPGRQERRSGNVRPRPPRPVPALDRRAAPQRRPRPCAPGAGKGPRGAR